MPQRPLENKKIIITRSEQQAQTFRKLLEEAGAVAVEIPTISILPRQVDAGRLVGSRKWDWIIFTSVNGVRIFLQQLENPADQLAGCQIAAIGPATAARIRQSGLRVALQPDTYQAEGLIEAFLREIDNPGGLRILIPRASQAREILPRQLRKAGAEVKVLAVYDTVLPEGSRTALEKTLQRSWPDLVTFTSSSTARNFSELAESLSEIHQIPAAAIGPVTAKTAQECGFRVIIQPVQSTIPDLCVAIVEHYSNIRADSPP